MSRRPDFFWSSSANRLRADGFEGPGYKLSRRLPWGDVHIDFGLDVEPEPEYLACVVIYATGSDDGEGFTFDKLEEAEAFVAGLIHESSRESLLQGVEVAADLRSAARSKPVRRKKGGGA